MAKATSKLSGSVLYKSLGMNKLFSKSVGIVTCILGNKISFNPS